MKPIWIIVLHNFLVHTQTFKDHKTLYLFSASADILEHSIDNLPQNDQQLIQSIKSSKRRAEVILKTWALTALFPNEDILKDSFGKPYLKSKKQHIGISHSGTYVAICVSTTPCSVDIEVPKAKILRLKDKFCNPDELEFCTSMEDYYKIWMAKECIYKLLGNASPQFYDYHLSKENDRYSIQYDGKDYPVLFGEFDALHYCIY